MTNKKSIGESNATTIRLGGNYFFGTKVYVLNFRESSRQCHILVMRITDYACPELQSRCMVLQVADQYKFGQPHQISHRTHVFCQHVRMHMGAQANVPAQRISSFFFPLLYSTQRNSSSAKQGRHLPHWEGRRGARESSLQQQQQQQQQQKE
jgi:hypothetical protein